MAIEVGTLTGKKHPIIGCDFTTIFAKSKDLFNWELLPISEYIYGAERYTCCPVIRFFNGYYYMVNLESAPFDRWISYLVRSKDLKNWELGEINPLLTPDDDDKKFAYPEYLTEEEKELIINAFDCNNSDVDFCDFNGKTIITYAWGNQLGREFLGLAEYDSSLKEFLESHFLK